MTITYDYQTGHLSNVIKSLRRVLGAYGRWNGHVKIGITNNPEQRLTAHKYNDGWEKMVVIYETSSWDSAKKAEKNLIDFAYEQSIADFEIWNEIGGGGGDQGEPPYFVYLLLE